MTKCEKQLVSRVSRSFVMAMTLQAVVFVVMAFLILPNMFIHPIEGVDTYNWMNAATQAAMMPWVWLVCYMFCR